MFLRVFVVIVGLAVLVGGLAGVKALQIRAMIKAGESMVFPPETVNTATASAETWENTLSAVASLRAKQGVQLAVETSGTVAHIGFESGASVQAGDLLLRLDASVEEAQLAGAKARLELATLNARRQAELVASKSGTQADLDAASASLAEARAEVDRLTAVIDEKSLRAPFAGRLGIRQVNLGQYLQPGAVVVSLQSLDTLLADFALPQQRVVDVKTGLAARITTDAAPDQVVAGVISAVQPEVDPLTRTLRAEAEFANTEGRLRPGMFANLSIVLPEVSQVVVIPSSAVLYAPYGDSVFIVEEKKDEKSGENHLVVRSQNVRLGRTKGDYVVVTSGLKGGETVVSTAPFKLRNGGRVVVNNSRAPETSATPTPPNT